MGAVNIVPTFQSLHWTTKEMNLPTSFFITTPVNAIFLLTSGGGGGVPLLEVSS